MTAPMTPLVGREESVAEATALLRRNDLRLLTITGPGGIGKTRLAHAVASGVADQFADGVVLVPLHAVQDAGLVVATIARSLGLLDFEGDLEQRIIDHLADAQLLLVVDNFEQVVEAAPSLAAIAAASPGLKVVVTSRTRLRVGGEQELPLAPLTPDAAHIVFLERARAVRPDLQPDEADLEAIAEICGQLDFLPLAIELAAARVKVLSPRAMVLRLEHPLELLTSGSRDAPARHRTLRDTIRWSVELLDDDGRALFQRLSVFAGGCTLDAAEDVCSGDLETLGSLVDESLVRSDGERFGMLETIREYAGELLQASPEAKSVRRAHAAFYLRLARAAAPDLAASDRASWRARLESDHDNLRAALRFSLDTGDASTALQLGYSLGRFWLERGYLSEGRLWLDEALAVPAEASQTRARALTANGVLCHYQADYRRAEELCRAALELSRTLGDPRGVAEALTGLALVRRTRGDYRDAEALFQEALSVYDDLGDEEASARTVDRFAIALTLAGDADRARALFERSLEDFRRLGDATGIALGLHGLVFARRPGNDLLALAQINESLDILRGLGDRRNVAKVLWSAADVNTELGHIETAATQIEESLTLCLEFGDRWFCGVMLESAATLAASGGDAERAVRIFGAADAVWAAIEAPLPACFAERHETVLAAVRNQMREDRFAAGWEEGRRLPLRTAIELVQPMHLAAGVDLAEGLTTREVEVLGLVANGLTDAEVAEQLVVSLRTVHAHLRSIYRKVGVHSRSAATRYALEHGLAA